MGRPWFETVPARIAATFRAAFKPTPAKRKLAGGSPSIHAGIVNGAPAMIAVVDDRVAGVVVLHQRDGKIAALHGIANKDSLTRATEQWKRTDHGEPLIASW
jgi:RNA polymerase sigma-70 factor (ECF subfamily)